VKAGRQADRIITGESRYLRSLVLHLEKLVSQIPKLIVAGSIPVSSFNGVNEWRRRC
jgi:hypothetical protein